MVRLDALAAFETAECSLSEKWITAFFRAMRTFFMRQREKSRDILRKVIDRSV